MNQVAEIKTNQNVVLRTELASIGSRVIGAVMDTFFLLIAYLIIIFLVNLFFDDDEFLIIGFLTLPLMFFTPICEQLFNGKTPAKMILGTKVIQINGETPTLEQSMARWFFRIFEILLHTSFK